MADNASLGNPITIGGKRSACYINSEFTKDGQPMLTFSSQDEEKTDISVYNPNLESVASITIPRKVNSYREISRRVLEYNPDGDRHDYVAHIVSTIEEGVAWINNKLHGHVSETTSNGVTYYYPTLGLDNNDVIESYVYFQYYDLGTAYPSIYYYITPSEYDPGKFEIHNVGLYEGSYIKTDQWTAPEVEVAYYYDGYLDLATHNYNTGARDNIYMDVTQTLFNDDEDFEYLDEDYTMELVETYDETGHSKSYYYGTIIHGVTVCSSNGNELMKISFPVDIDIKEVYASLEFIGDKKYLSFELEYYDSEKDHYEYIYLYYEIEKGANSLRQVGEPIKVKVRPTVIGPDESVNVQFSETKGESRIIVTDMKGRTLLNSKVNAEGSYQIPGRIMSNDMNIITVDTPEGKQSTKVVVR